MLLEIENPGQGGVMVQGRYGFHTRRSYFPPARYRPRLGVDWRRLFAVIAGVFLIIWAGSMLIGSKEPSIGKPGSLVSPSNIVVNTVGQIAREGARLGPAMGGWLSMDPERGKSILQQTLPVPAESLLEAPPQLSWQDRLRFWLYIALDYDITQPKTLLEAALPHPAPSYVVVQIPGKQNMQAANSVVITQTEHPEPTVSTQPNLSDVYSDMAASVKHADSAALVRLQQTEWGSEPLVLIYHTHTSEMYRESVQGGATEPHRYNTTSTGIVRVGEALAKTLSDRYGIPVVHSKAIHDFPRFAHAYTNSANTVRSLLAKYPSIKVVIDVHRDAAANISFVREINGINAAQVMVVVSKLGATKPSLHPHWQDNMRFASQMEAAMQGLYPGMLRRYPPVSSRYNQQLHSNALLLEIGNYADSEIYALRSAVLMADVVALMADATKKSPVRTATTPVKPAQPASTDSRKNDLQSALKQPTANRPAPSKPRP